MPNDNRPPAVHRTPILRVASLCKEYAHAGWFGRRSAEFAALDHVCLEVPAGSITALVGPSGSGKSTLARCLVRLEEATSGEVWFMERNVLCMSAADLLRLRQDVQLIFQGPGTTLNPRLSAVEIVSEPLYIQRRGTARDRLTQALELMKLVGLPDRYRHRSSLELSGGQRQRLAIARALALDPKFLILDEALSGLDLSIQAQIVNLLLELQSSRGLTYLYISHDLGLIGHLADQVAVMHQGRIVEYAPTVDLFANPRHPITRALLESTPVLPGQPRGSES